MPYDTGTPQPTDIPRDSQEEFFINFDELNDLYGTDHIPLAGKIVSATSANPCVINSPDHRLESLDSITLSNMKGINSEGLPQLWSINDTAGIVTFIDVDNFSVALDASAENDYIAEMGSWITSKANFYGFHKKIIFGNNQTTINQLFR